MGLKEGDFVRYRSDGMKGRVTAVTSAMVTVHLTDKPDAHLHPLDAKEALEVWRGPARTGRWEGV